MVCVEWKGRQERRAEARDGEGRDTPPVLISEELTLRLVRVRIQLMPAAVVTESDLINGLQKERENGCCCVCKVSGARGDSDVTDSGRGGCGGSEQ